MTDEEMKQWIAAASYEDLLRKWRFEPAGSNFFSPSVGAYFSDTMVELRNGMSYAEAVEVSKKIGWEEEK